jgi:hypothetical protein
MWKPEYARRFLVLLDRFPNTLTASFAAHTHMDEFRLIGHGDHMRSFTLSTPGISPIFGQNPGFHVHEFCAVWSIARPHHVRFPTPTTAPLPMSILMNTGTVFAAAEPPIVRSRPAVMMPHCAHAHRCNAVLRRGLPA